MPIFVTTGTTSASKSGPSTQPEDICNVYMDLTVSDIVHDEKITKLAKQAENKILCNSFKASKYRNFIFGNDRQGQQHSL